MCCLSVFTLRLRNFENLVENAIIPIEGRLYSGSNFAFLEPITTPSVLLNRPDAASTRTASFHLCRDYRKGPEAPCIECGWIRSCTLWFLDFSGKGHDFRKVLRKCRAWSFLSRISASSSSDIFSKYFGLTGDSSMMSLRTLFSIAPPWPRGLCASRLGVSQLRADPGPPPVAQASCHRKLRALYSRQP